MIHIKSDTHIQIYNYASKVHIVVPNILFLCDFLHIYTFTYTSIRSPLFAQLMRLLSKSCTHTHTHLHAYIPTYIQYIHTFINMRLKFSTNNFTKTAGLRQMSSMKLLHHFIKYTVYQYIYKYTNIPTNQCISQHNNTLPWHEIS